MPMLITCGGWWEEEEEEMNGLGGRSLIRRAMGTNPDLLHLEKDSEEIEDPLSLLPSVCGVHVDYFRAVCVELAAHILPKRRHP